MREGGRDVGYQNTLPRFLLNLSFAVRLCIAITSVLVFLIVFLLLPPPVRNPSVFAVPMALSAWMFRRSGAYLCLFVLIVTLWLYYSLYTYNGLLLPPLVTIYFVIGTISLLIIGLLISSQRDSFDLADDAQQQLAIAYEQQQKLSQIKDQFLQNVNHELRTPLTAIYGYLELLHEHSDNLDEHLRATFLEHAMQSCDELQLLVNNVLDSMSEGRERRPYVCVEELAVLDIVHEVLERFDPKTLQAHTIHVDVPTYIVVRANPQYTRQVLRNLLSNAFKYAPAGTPIFISASLYGTVVEPLHPSPEICVRVRDTGPGIPPNEIPLLFGQFVRLNRDTSGKVRGSGLGLYLSRQFVEMMGGHIWVESDGIAGHGSCFCFTLPCVPRSALRAQIENYSVYTVTAPSDTAPSDAHPV